MAVEVREEATAIFGTESVNQSKIGFLVREPDLTRFASQMTKAVKTSRRITCGITSARPA